MKTIRKCVEDIKDILNTADKAEEIDGDVLVEVNELIDTILSINGQKDEPQEPIRNDRCTCPRCGTHNEIIKKRRNTVGNDIVYCWHCGQAILVN